MGDGARAISCEKARRWLAQRRRSATCHPEDGRGGHKPRSLCWQACTTRTPSPASPSPCCSPSRTHTLVASWASEWNAQPADR